jgi:hypothetical protein
MVSLTPLTYRAFKSLESLHVKGVRETIPTPVHQLFTVAMLLEVSITQVAEAELDYALDGQHIDLAGFDEE